jgi:hypothetical protein
MYHYVYRLDLLETGEFYFGSRTCKCNPVDDVYMGSMTRWKPDKSKLKKTIINQLFLTREDALEEEARLIKENINNILIRNYYIPNKNFHTTGWGYWTGKIGPHKGHRHTDEVKERQRKMMLGTTHSDETKSKMSNSHKGKVKSVEHRLNLSKALSGKPKSNYHKKIISEVHKIPIIQYDKFGNFIKEWNGIIDAQRELNITHITDVCKGRTKSAGGYVWKYKK